MMPQDQMSQMSSMPQDDESQEKSEMDMIKQALMKVIADMTAMESDRFTPDDKKPQPAPVDAQSTEEPMDLGEEDPKMLDSLMGDADKADASGAMPEDRENDLPPEIMDVVRRKKAEMK